MQRRVAGAWSEELAPAATLGELVRRRNCTSSGSTSPRAGTGERSIRLLLNWLRLSDFRLLYWGYSRYSLRDIRSTVGNVRGTTVLGADIATVADIQPGMPASIARVAERGPATSHRSSSPGSPSPTARTSLATRWRPAATERGRHPTRATGTGSVTSWASTHQTHYGWFGRRSDSTSIVDIDAKDARVRTRTAAGHGPTTSHPSLPPAIPSRTAPTSVGVDIEPGCATCATDSTNGTSTECFCVAALRLRRELVSRRPRGSIWLRRAGWNLSMVDIDSFDVGLHEPSGCGTWSSDLTPQHNARRAVWGRPLPCGHRSRTGPLPSLRHHRDSCSWLRLSGFREIRAS